MAAGSENMVRMIGKKTKPFCGNCCSEYKPGSGKAHKRKIKKIDKRREERFWRRDQIEG